jgi:hypothetical protein
MKLLRRPDRFLLLTLTLLLVGALLCATPAEAGNFRYANIYWCAATENYQRPTSNTITFFVQISESRFAGQVVGDVVYEPFYFGDGTSTVMALTVTEVHPDEDWFLAKGEVVHTYSPTGDALLSAGIEGCCRIDGLNNRSGGPYRAKVVVSRNARVGQCSPKIFLNPIVSLYTAPGDPVDIPVPVTSNGPIQCLLAGDSEAGGGPSPSGMRIGTTNCIISWGNPGGPFPFWTAQVKIEGYDYPETGRLISSGVVDFLLRFLPDVTPPVCRVDRIDQGPPTRLSIYIQDIQAGLSAIDVLLQTNATINIPSLSPGYTGSVIVVGTKIDESQPARIQLRVRDRAGNVTECDPVVTGEARAAGRPERHVFPEIPPEEHFVTLLNGNPGLTQLQIDVNGRNFTIAGLEEGEERTIDVGSAVMPGVASTVTLTTHGKPGGVAAIMIWDGRSE